MRPAPARLRDALQIKMIVILGELGGQDEYTVVAALKDGRITKPVVAWVTGTCAKMFKSDVQFGHAGARRHVLHVVPSPVHALTVPSTSTPTMATAFIRLSNSLYHLPIHLLRQLLLSLC